MKKTFVKKKSLAPKASAIGKDYIKTVERLISMLSQLDKGAAVSTADLSNKLGVTQRTIQRDLDLLCRSGYPIMQEERGRYRFMEGFSLKKVELSEEQASLLSFMFDISHSLGSKFEDSFRGLFKRVLARDMDTPFYAKIPAGTKLPCDVRMVRDLEDAIHDCERVRMTYQPEGKEAKEYLLEPFKIAFYDGFWYLIANDVVRKRLLKLRLERIKAVTHTSEAFIPPANLMTLLEQSVNIWFEEKRGERVLIRVAPEDAMLFLVETPQGSPAVLS